MLLDSDGIDESLIRDFFVECSIINSFHWKIRPGAPYFAWKRKLGSLFHESTMTDRNFDHEANLFFENRFANSFCLKIGVIVIQNTD